MSEFLKSKDRVILVLKEKVRALESEVCRLRSELHDTRASKFKNKDCLITADCSESNGSDCGYKDYGSLLARENFIFIRPQPKIPAIEKIGKLVRIVEEDMEMKR